MEDFKLGLEHIEYMGALRRESMTTVRPANPLVGATHRQIIEHLTPFYRIDSVSFFKQARFIISDLFNTYMASDKRPNFNEIIPGLFLGRLPRDGEAHFDVPVVDLVVSVIEPWEIAQGMGVGYVLEPSDWKLRNTKHILIDMKDFSADVDTNDVLNAIFEMKKMLDDHKKVYVHCKAGRSRSAMICAIYLAMYSDIKEIVEANNDEERFNKACDFISGIRPHVDVDPGKIKKGQEILRGRNNFTHFGAIDRSRSPADEKHFVSEHDYIASDDIKIAIKDFTSFKSMKVYAYYAQNYQKPYATCQRTSHIREFFDDILKSTDGGWYNRLINEEDPIKKLLEADKLGQDDKNRRAKLVSDFMEELQLHIESKHLLRSRLVRSC